MKTLSNKAMVIIGLMMMLSNLGTAAIEIPGFLLKKTTKQSFILQKITDAKENIQVAIFDNEGNRLYTKENFTKDASYNLSQLENGAYTFVIEHLKFIKTIPFQIENEEFNFVEADVTTTYKPTVTVEDNRIKFNLLAFDKNASVSILDSEMHLLHNESFEGQSNIQQLYNLKKVAAGTYYVSTSVNGFTFTDKVIVE